MQSRSQDNERSYDPEGISDKSSFGLQPNVAAMLSYAVVWITGTVAGWLIGLLFLLPLVERATEREVLVMSVLFSFISQIIATVIACGAGFIFFSIEKENRFVRLHAIQAILFYVFNVAALLLFNLLSLVASVAMPKGSASSGLAAVGFFTVLTLLFWITFLALWLLQMVKAYKGNRLELPYISDMAENIVSKSASGQSSSSRAHSVDRMKTCPECAESIKDAAKTCRFCGHKFLESQMFG